MLLFIAGLFIGANFGVVIFSLLSVNRANSLDAKHHQK